VAGVQDVEEQLPRQPSQMERSRARRLIWSLTLIDDIGYVQQNRDEMDVLFTFLAERYERKSVLITSNLVFSEWNRIFKDPMTTAAAIDRLVHHAVILELTGTSVRADAAQAALKEARTTTTTPTTTTPLTQSNEEKAPTTTTTPTTTTPGPQFNEVNGEM
jgi:hypothetical protein